MFYDLRAVLLEEMEEQMRLNRTVLRSECPWLDRDYAKGEEVVRYTGHTYGCISPEGEAYTIDGKTPFFERSLPITQRTSTEDPATFKLEPT
jgi:hypothetical protein